MSSFSPRFLNTCLSSLFVLRVVRGSFRFFWICPMMLTWLTEFRVSFPNRAGRLGNELINEVLTQFLMFPRTNSR